MIPFTLIFIAVTLALLVMGTAFLVRSYLRRREAEKARASAWSKYQPFRDEHQSREKTRMLTLKELGLAALVLIASVLMAVGFCANATAQSLPVLYGSTIPAEVQSIPAVVRIGDSMTQELVGAEVTAGVQAGPLRVKASLCVKARLRLITFIPDPSLFRLTVDPDFYSSYDLIDISEGIYDSPVPPGAEESPATRRL